MLSMKHDIPISNEMIRLGQFLKMSNAVDTGGEAKIRIKNGEVLVNGEVETRRGRQLRIGDTVEIGDLCMQIVSGQAE